MPGARTAQQLVRQMRETVQELATATYRDGFSSDPDTSSSLISLLNFLNRAVGIFCRSGIVEDDFSFVTASGVFRVAAPSGAGRYVDVSLELPGESRPLKETTLVELQARSRSWRSSRGVPNVYISRGQQIWLAPVPNAVYSGVLRAHGLQQDLVNPNDVPSKIPQHYHDALADLGAILVCASDAENSGRQARLSYLVSLFEFTYPDLRDMVQARSLLAGFGQQIGRPEGGTPTVGNTGEADV